jgi:hypothetical protein
MFPLAIKTPKDWEKIVVIRPLNALSIEQAVRDWEQRQLQRRPISCTSTFSTTESHQHTREGNEAEF